MIAIGIGDEMKVFNIFSIFRCELSTTVHEWAIIVSIDSLMKMSAQYSVAVKKENSI